MKTFIAKDERGIALVTTSLISVSILTVALSVFLGSMSEIRLVNREIARVRSSAAAEAGIQRAMAQIGNAYTGFVNVDAVNNPVQLPGTKASDSYSATMTYPNQADWVIINATATVEGETRTLEARIFLESNLSKYLVYSTIGAFNAGANAKYGVSDGINPAGVPADESERPSMYFKGSYNAVGSNVEVYGDVNAEGEITGDSTTKIHGDTYSGNFKLTASGAILNDGITNFSDTNINDGFDDHIDRDGNGVITKADGPDRHALNAAGGGDAHAKETLKPLDLNFYKTNNNLSTFAGSTAKDRYVIFKSNGSTTTVEEYKDLTWAQVKTSYVLPENAIVYVNGNLYTKSGDIEGRISVVSSKNIYFDGDVSYSKASQDNYADPTHAVAWMAKDEIYLRSSGNQSVTGIFYAENVSGGSTAIEAAYDTNGKVYGEADKGTLYMYGNRIMNGQGSTSVFQDRTFVYDQNLKYYRPPGLPVTPSLKVVRET